MKKIIVIVLVVTLALFSGWNILYAQGCGGMQHEGGTMGGGDMSSHSDHQDYGGHQHGQPLTPGQARTVLENHLKSKNNPDLIVGDISEGEDYFEAEITTQEGDPVDKIRVDKYTGLLDSAYLPKAKVEENISPETHQGHGN